MPIINPFAVREKNRGYKQKLIMLSQRPMFKVSGLISLTIFTVSFFGLFAILPTFKTIARLNKEIQDAELVNNKLSKKILALKEAEVVYSQITGRLDKINAVLPEQTKFERLAWQIQWLAMNKQVEVSSGSFGEFNLLGAEETAENGMKTLPIDLTVTGEYAKIKDFLKTIVKIDQLLTIDNLSIATKKAKGEGGLISVNLKLTAYYLPSTDSEAK